MGRGEPCLGTRRGRVAARLRHVVFFRKSQLKRLEGCGERRIQDSVNADETCPLNTPASVDRQNKRDTCPHLSGSLRTWPVHMPVPLKNNQNSKYRKGWGFLYLVFLPPEKLQEKRTLNVQTRLMQKEINCFDLNASAAWHHHCHGNTPVPGCGENGVDNWILRILGAHQEHVLCGDTKGRINGEACASFSPSF